MSVSYFNDLHGKAIRKHTYTYIHTCMCVCMYICVYIYVCMCVFLFLINLAIVSYQSLENLVTTQSLESVRLQTVLVGFHTRLKSKLREGVYFGLVDTLQKDVQVGKAAGSGSWMFTFSSTYGETPKGSIRSPNSSNSWAPSVEYMSLLGMGGGGTSHSNHYKDLLAFMSLSQTRFRAANCLRQS